MEPIRRFVDADNSCLFSSIGYLVDNDHFNETTKLHFRQIISDYIKNNNFEEGLFGMPKEEYALKILDIKSRGGGIEFKIFSDMYKIEIASIDVQTNRVNIYGEDNGFKRRIYLVYNGVHYDPLVLNNGEDLSEDITVFESEDNEILKLFTKYIKIFKEAGDYVDFSNKNKFECDQCQTIFESQEEALEHAQEFEHWNILEFIPTGENHLY